MISRIWNTILDRGEPLAELVIRLCGWSAIFFVFGIFFFIFLEGAPFLTNRLQYEAKDTAADGGGTKRSLVITQIPFEDPVEMLLEEIEKARAGQRLRGVSHAEFDTDEDANLILVLDLEPNADADEVRRQLLAAVPMRADAGHLWSFVSSQDWNPLEEQSTKRSYGIFTLIVGTLSVTLLAMAICVPFGLGSAIYVSEFCSGKVRETLKIVIEFLAAIPSIVWGFIGYFVLKPFIEWSTGAALGINMLNGAIILALMSVPIIVSVGEDALKAVPDSYREAAVALGASRWQLIYKVLLPAARNGLLAAVLLGIGRAVGETMAVLMATGHAVQIPHSVLDPIRTLTATIAAEMGEASGGQYHALFVIGMVLMFMAFVVNFTADVIVKGIRGDQNA